MQEHAVSCILGEIPYGRSTLSAVLGRLRTDVALVTVGSTVAG